MDHPDPLPWDEAGMRYLADGAKKLRADSDRAIVGLFGGSIFEGGQQFFRIDNFYIRLSVQTRSGSSFSRQVDEHLYAAAGTLSEGSWSVY